MIPEIEQFLAATDLDVAQHVLADVTDISRQDAVHLAEIVVAWAPPQAIANMLLHPSIIPPAHQVSAMLRGLATDARHYPLIAAVVGLREIDLPVEYRRSVAVRLLDLAATDGEQVSSLASVSLVRYLYHLDTGDVLARFEHFGPTARHNVLVGLLEALGEAGLRTHVDRVRASGSMSVETADETGHRVDELLAQSGGSTLLARIPDLVEWEARPAPAPYPGS